MHESTQVEDVWGEPPDTEAQDEWSQEAVVDIQADEASERGEYYWEYVENGVYDQRFRRSGSWY